MTCLSGGRLLERRRPHLQRKKVFQGLCFIIGVRNDVNVDYKFPIDTHSETNLFSTKKWVPLKKVIPLLAIDEEKYYFSQRAVEGMKNAKNNMKRGLYQEIDFLPLSNYSK